MSKLYNLQKYREKLEKVNSIIAKIADENENITPILPSDYALFEDFFHKEKQHTYGNSWLYVTQGAFGIGPEMLGYKYYDGKNLCTLAIYPKIEQPNIIMLYWIRPLGAGILPVIVKLADEIKREYSINSYVKKLFSEQYEFLLQHGFRSAKEFPWHSAIHSEDDTYPELIFEREKTLKTIKEASTRSRIGRVIKGVNKLKRENIVGITESNFKKNAWNIVNSYFAEFNNFANKINVSCPFDYYNMIFKDYLGKNNVEKKIVLVNQKPVGFYILMHDRKFDVTSIYSYITLRNQYKYLTDLLNLFVLENEKSKYINDGGSEDLGIYNFKKKYFPVKEKIMCWVTNYSS